MRALNIVKTILQNTYRNFDFQDFPGMLFIKYLLCIVFYSELATVSAGDLQCFVCVCVHAQQTFISALWQHSVK